MTNPIINHYGAYVRAPEKYTPCYKICHASGGVVILSVAWGCITARYALNLGLLYVTREAAEAALTRAKCIQRLSVMAYKDWRPKSLNTTWEVIIPAVGGIGIHAETVEQRDVILKSITPEDRDAFLYVYKEGE